MNILNKYILNENTENEYIYSLLFKAIFPYNWKFAYYNVMIFI